MDLTGFDDNAVRKGLNTLLVLGLATCTGDKRRTAWQLVPAAQRLPLPLEPLLRSLENGESAPMLDSAAVKSVEITLPTNSTRPLPTPSQKAPRSANNNQHRTLESPAPSHSRGSRPRPPRPAPPLNCAGAGQRALGPVTERGVNDERVLRLQFYAAFEAANIYLQFRRPLADNLLAAGGPAWLRQTFGWICYAQRRLPHVQRGAVVYISLRDRLPCDPAYLPPPDLPFDAALAWAVRGGEDEPADEPDGDVIDASDTADADQTLRVSDSPEDDLWRAVIERLARELPGAVIDARLRPARLISLDGDRCLIAAPTPQSRDWLAARLSSVLARAVRELTGRELAIEVVVDT